MSGTSVVEAKEGLPGGWLAAAFQAWRLWCPVALLLLLWGRLFSTLVLDWKVDPQYAHGWFIPVLALVLAATRWPTRPPAAPSSRPGLAYLLLAAALLPLVPLTFLQAVYPEARPFEWAHGLLAAGITSLFLWLHGGFRWARHFAFPVAFLLLAIPWPRAWQNGITDHLMHSVAATAVEVTLLTGTPATQQGNVIALAGGTVGIDEACSGVRSLQGSMVAALFLGSYFPMAALARVALLVLSVAGALLLNIVRACLLTWISAHHGREALARFHDPAGLLILAVVFVATAGLASYLAKRWPPARSESSAAVSMHSLPARSLGVISLWALLLLLAMDAACYAYFAPLPRASAASEWSLDLAPLGGTVTDAPISPTARQFLRYDRAYSKSVILPDGTAIQVVDLHWQGGEISAAGARLHHPTICLPSIGYRLDELLPPVTLRLPPLAASFDGAAFEAGAGKVYVYHALWENGRSVDAGDPFDQSLHSAFRAICERRRLARARVLMLMIGGVENPAKAREILESVLRQAVVAAPSPQVDGDVH